MSTVRKPAFVVAETPAYVLYVRGGAKTHFEHLGSLKEGRYTNKGTGIDILSSV